jgi:hypothetical protein
MATRTLRNKPGAVYFATFTCYQWWPLFKETDGYELFYHWMHLAYDKGYRFLGYVILPMPSSSACTKPVAMTCCNGLAKACAPATTPGDRNTVCSTPPLT